MTSHRAVEARRRQTLKSDALARSQGVTIPKHHNRAARECHPHITTLALSTERTNGAQD